MTNGVNRHSLCNASLFVFSAVISAGWYSSRLEEETDSKALQWKLWMWEAPGEAPVDIPGSGTHVRGDLGAASQTSWWGDAADLCVPALLLSWDERVLGMQDLFTADTWDIFYLSCDQLCFGDIGGEWNMVPPLTPMAASQTSALAHGLSHKSISI